MRIALIVVLTFVSLSSVEGQTPSTAAVPSDAGLVARATFVSSAGQTLGDALLRETPNGVLLKVNLESAPPGVRAFHIHETGRCEPPTFESAGGHFAAGGAEHGLLDANQPHAGDLPNVHVPADGRLSFEILVPTVTLSAGASSLLDADGSALVMHRNPDDYTTDPAGAAGDRIACGVIMR